MKISRYVVKGNDAIYFLNALYEEEIQGISIRFLAYSYLVYLQGSQVRPEHLAYLDSE